MLFFFKRLFLKKEKILAFKIIFFLIVAAVLEFLSLGSLLPLLSILSGSGGVDFSYVFDGKTKDEVIYFICLGVLSLFIFRTIFLWRLIKLQAFFSYKLMERISSDIFQNYSRSVTILDPNRDNAVIYRNIIREPNLLVGGVVLPVLNIATEFSIILGVTCFLVWYSPYVTICAALLLIMIGGVVFLLFEKKLSGFGSCAQKSESLRIREVYNLLSGAKDLFVVNMVKVFYEKFNEQTKSLSNKLALQQVYKQSSKICIEFSAILAIAILVSSLIFFGYSSAEVVSIVSLYLAALLRILPAMNRIIVNLNTLSFNRSSLAVISSELSMPAVVDNNNYCNNEIDFTNWDNFSLSQVSFCYANNPTPVFSNVDLTIKSGEKIAIIGASGSGKTTLVDIILGLKITNTGSIAVHKNGTSYLVKGLPSSMVSYVPQKVFLFDGTIEENITLVDFYQNTVDYFRLNEVIEKSGLTDLIGSLPEGIRSKVGEDGSSLSGGQLQRIGLARALYRNSDVLILDEATSGLDEYTEQSIINLLLNDSKLTILCITHSKKLVSNFDSTIEIGSL